MVAVVIWGNNNDDGRIIHDTDIDIWFDNNRTIRSNTIDDDDDDFDTIMFAANILEGEFLQMYIVYSYIQYEQLL